MRFQTLRDAIHFARELHEEIGDRYANLRNQTAQERTRMLLDYLTRHERHLEQVLGRYERDTSRTILDAWYQYAPNHTAEEITASIELFAEMGVDEILGQALRLDDYFIEIYREMASAAPNVHVREVCQNLLDMEQNEKMRSVRGALRLQDI